MHRWRTIQRETPIALGMQAPPEVLDWLQAIGFRRSIVAMIAAGQYGVPPTLAAMQASIAAMRELLHMSDAQVRRKL